MDGVNEPEENDKISNLLDPDAQNKPSDVSRKNLTKPQKQPVIRNSQDPTNTLLTNGSRAFKGVKDR
ncbi:hypothetical protein HanPSC8_Chr17g0798041 [Helianthus annuus]|nr:hypothetical protein HanPSC8_Chr17g0798041 [Helianthus annuus]